MTETIPNKGSIKQAIDEADKPFFLLLSAMIMLFVSILYTLYLGQWIPEYRSVWIQIAAVFGPLISAGWTFYFTKKTQ